MQGVAVPTRGTEAQEAEAQVTAPETPEDAVARARDSLASTMCEMASIGLAADETIHSEHGPPCEFCAERVRLAFAEVIRAVEARVRAECAAKVERRIAALAPTASLGCRNELREVVTLIRATEAQP